MRLVTAFVLLFLADAASAAKLVLIAGGGKEPAGPATQTKLIRSLRCGLR